MECLTAEAKAASGAHRIIDACFDDDRRFANVAMIAVQVKIQIAA